MAKGIDKEVKDGVQGTPPVTDDAANHPDPDFGDSSGDAQPETEAPKWVGQLLESNREVIESNNAVIEAIKTLSENARGVVEGIINEANGELPKEERPDVVVSRKAKYVVIKGKKFADKEADGVIREAGFDVSKFAPERIKSLLQQGIVEEQ